MILLCSTFIFDCLQIYNKSHTHTHWCNNNWVIIELTTIRRDTARHVFAIGNKSDRHRFGQDDASPCWKDTQSSFVHLFHIVGVLCFVVVCDGEKRLNKSSVQSTGQRLRVEKMKNATGKRLS